MSVIITKLVCPPIPIRGLDWSAYRDGYDDGDPVGVGETELEAIINLIEIEQSL